MRFLLIALFTASTALAQCQSGLCQQVVQPAPSGIKVRATADIHIPAQAESAARYYLPPAPIPSMIPTAPPMQYAIPQAAPEVRYYQEPQPVQYEFVPTRVYYTVPARVVYQKTYAAPAYEMGGYTKAEYGLFGRLRRFETSGDPQAIPRSSPGPLRQLFTGGR